MQGYKDITDGETRAYMIRWLINARKYTGSQIIKLTNNEYEKVKALYLAEKSPDCEVKK